VTRGSGSADLRAFRWRLGLLLRHREWQVEQAKSRLAQQRQAVSTMRARLERLEGAQADDAQHARDLVQRWLGSPAHACAIRHLVAQRDLASGERGQLALLEQRAAAAQAECVRAQQACETVSTLRERALQDYVRQALQREAAADDAAWIARQKKEPVWDRA
jgi:flagellar export protein FliJ